MLLLLALALISGFVGSMPVAGPVAVLVLRAAFRGRSEAALQIAAGCAVAEGTYGAFAFVGVAALAQRYAWFGTLAGFGGALVLVLVGSVLVFKRQPLDAAPPQRPSLIPAAAGQWLLGFSATALNPTIVASWTAVVTSWHGMGLVHNAAGSDAVVVGVGIAAGVVLWFYVLTRLVARYRAYVTERTLQRVVQALGAAMVVGGIWMGASHLRHYLQSAVLQGSR